MMSDNGSLSKRNDKIYVSNVDYSCNHQDLKELFQKVGKVAFVEMLRDKNNKPNGCAVVRFKDNDMVDKAIDDLNRYEYKGRKIVIKSCRDAPASTPMSMDRSTNDRKRPRDDDYGHMEPVKKYGNTFGLSVNFLESLGIDGPLNNRIFVANLPYDVAEEDLKDLFSLCGKVEDVELVHGDDGKSKGFGFIDFEHPIEAVQAISMLHNQAYHDRKLSVQYTQRDKRSKTAGPRLPPGLVSIGMGLGVNGEPLRDIARTIETGQQQSLLGAAPLSSSNIGSLGLGIGLNSSMNRNFSTSLAADLRGNASHLMTTSLRDNLMGVSNVMDAPTSLPFRNSRPMGTSSNLGLGSSLLGARNCIEVSNLPPDYTWKALCDLCQTFGEVSFAKITGRGLGVVHFENDAAARRATDMLDQQEFEGQFLEAKCI